MRIESKNSGLVVVISDEEYGVLLAEHAGKTREWVLNAAGRVLKHRRILENIKIQQLTDDQQRQVDSLAKALAVQSIIDTYLIDHGYGNYVMRRDNGGMMPESFGRICDRAREACADEIAHATPDASDVAYAMSELGFYNEDDADWSGRNSKWCNWEITAPAGWGESK